jgi:hypothetical protein
MESRCSSNRPRYLRDIPSRQTAQEASKHDYGRPLSIARLSRSELRGAGFDPYLPLPVAEEQASTGPSSGPGPTTVTINVLALEQEVL